MISNEELDVLEKDLAFAANGVASLDMFMDVCTEALTAIRSLREGAAKMADDAWKICLELGDEESPESWDATYGEGFEAGCDNCAAVIFNKIRNRYPLPPVEPKTEGEA